MCTSPSSAIWTTLGRGVLFLVFCLVLTDPLASSAATLRLTSYDQAPRYFLAVNKSSQTFYVLQRKSPLKALRQFECSTGDQPGNKQSEGDERTPEGVYFLENVRTSGLDYELYGDVAYTLNYPNPIDRIRGKTGYGIWVHGRGKELVPRDTRGCIALEGSSIKSLTDEVDLHLTPVLIGSDTVFSPAEEEVSKTAARLSRKVSAWAEAWQEKSQTYFSFYNQEKYTLASDSTFKAFRAHKETLFDNYAWIDVYLDEVRVLAGPDYWVTYFGQYFRSPTYISEGVKRIYWQRGDQGWRIVGEEWRDKPLDLEQEYLAEASGRIKGWLDRWRTAWRSADLQGYLQFYQAGARQQGRYGRQSIADYKRQLWKDEEPSRIAFEEVTVDLHRRGFEISFLQRYHGQDGYSDYGRKTLIVQPSGEGFQIVNEQWTAVSSS